MKSISLRLFTATIVSLFSINLMASEIWTGNKVIHSVSGDRLFSLKLEFIDGTTGKAVTDSGQSMFVYSTKEKDQVDLAMSGKILAVAFPFLVHETLCEKTSDPLICSPQQVRQESTLRSMTLKSLNPQQVRLSETWERCAAFPAMGGHEAETVCKMDTVEISDALFMEDSLSMTPLAVKDSDKLVVGVPGNNSAYLQLNGDKTVTVLLGSFEEKPSVEFDAYKINSWELKSGQLVLGTTDGEELTYSKTQEHNGVSRVIADYKSKDAKEMTFAADLMVDQSVDMSKATMDEMSGLYKTVSIGTLNESTEYTFEKDGFGGYQFFGGFSVEPLKTIWAWKMVAGEMQATQYRTKEGAYIQDKAALQACLASLGETPTCEPRMQRTYKVLAKDGNRYTTLRTLNVYSLGSAEPSIRQLSTWVFYKK